MCPNRPAPRYLRLKQIIGDRKANPPIEPMLPISKSSWWKGVADGRFPAPIKLGPNTSVWRCADIEAAVERLAVSPPAAIVKPLAKE